MSKDKPSQSAPEPEKPAPEPTSPPQTDPSARPAPSAPTSGEEGQDGPEVLKEAHEKGYLGETPDDTPNEDYTVEGVTSGPDVTDPEYAEQQGVKPDDSEASEGKVK